MSKKSRKADKIEKRKIAFTPEQISGNLSSLVGQAVRDALTGVDGAWQGPGQPLAAQHQEIAGRQTDYNAATNLNYSPRTYEAVDFKTLRTLADSYDLMRLIIDTRKDQLCKMQWKIIGIDDDTVVDDDPRVEMLKKFLLSPDRIHNWQTWLRMLVEDQLVIDAACLYPRLALDGSLYALEIMDGATIKVLVNADGRRPLAPDPAYQQIIKGVPAVDYSSDELIYMPRNKRSWKFYGQSNVEQVMMTVNIALRRQIHQLQYYTEGNIPEALACVPQDWKPQQIKEMQQIWDSLLEGNTGQRRHMKFIPGAQKIEFTKVAALKDDYDEWLARIVCYAFSVSPTPFVKQQNRATAESAQEAAISEGLLPIMHWVKDWIDYIIVRYFGFTDLQFSWSDQRDVDPKTQAEIHKIYIDAGVLLPNEVRNAIGYDPNDSNEAAAAQAANGSAGAEDGNAQRALAGVTSDSSTGAVAAVPGSDSTASASAVNVQATAMNGAQITALAELMDSVASESLPAATVRAIVLAAFPGVDPTLVDAMLAGLKGFEQVKPDPPMILQPPQAAAGAPAPGAASAPPSAAPKPKAGVPKADKPVKPVAKARSIDGEVKRLSKALASALAKTGARVTKQIIKAREEPDVANKKRKPPLIAQLDFSDMDKVKDALWLSIDGTATGASDDAFNSVKVYDDRLVNLGNSRAERWAANHAAELIGKGADGGELIGATRDMIRATVADAEATGMSNADLQKALISSYAFSEQRAEVIARTELKIANGAGNMIGYRASGVVGGKEWQTSESDACPECLENEDAGTVDLDQDFPSGDDTVPAHPNCNCTVNPILVDDYEPDNTDDNTEE